jgi:hypothetical protein
MMGYCICGIFRKSLHPTSRAEIADINEISQPLRWWTPHVGDHFGRSNSVLKGMHVCNAYTLPVAGTTDDEMHRQATPQPSSTPQ